MFPTQRPAPIPKCVFYNCCDESLSDVFYGLEATQTRRASYVLGAGQDEALIARCACSSKYSSIFETLKGNNSMNANNSIMFNVVCDRLFMHDARPARAWLEPAEKLLRDVCSWNDPNGEWLNHDDVTGNLPTVEDMLVALNEWCADDPAYAPELFRNYLNAIGTPEFDMSGRRNVPKDEAHSLKRINGELVEALRDLVAVYDKVGGPLAVDPAVKRARAALAKAGVL